MNSKAQVLIGIGSNLPWAGKTSVDIVRDALQALRVHARSGFRASSLYRTTPVDCPPGSEHFINAAAAFEAHQDLTPEKLLTEVKALERTFGRGGSWQRNAPRPLDVDVLTFGSETRASNEFILPHPRATQRAFVLVPL
ncbi:MAG: 2-amino-4-hydroxy-6-hydroxymethyldihydropteridine diphosphokinase, partial [Gammaproteobacteria bacterium]|nr:2-amino-4-hydroxy-6-hydroxymethyldihydropteridine diphosphokinase [Gammaproteobacteria bacterium]